MTHNSWRRTGQDSSGVPPVMRH